MASFSAKSNSTISRNANKCNITGHQMDGVFSNESAKNVVTHIQLLKDVFYSKPLEHVPASKKVKVKRK